MVATTTIPSLTIVNAKAVSLLERGMHQQAVHELSTAVKQCTTALFEPSSVTASVNHKLCHEELYVATAVVPKEPALQHGQNDFFTRPFHFMLNQHRTNEGQPLPKQVSAGCVAVCCYNMALACHLEWARRNCNDSRVLQHAHRCYRKAYSALQLCQLQPTDSLLLLMMAVCTNLICVETKIGSLHTVQSLKENLTATIVYADKRQFHDNESFRQLFHATVLFRSDLVAARAA
jgi:hypothetical protein